PRQNTLCATRPRGAERPCLPGREVRSALRKGVDLVLDWGDVGLQTSPVLPCVGEAMPCGEDFLQRRKHCLAPISDFSPALRKGGDISFEMRKAHLAALHREDPVDPLAIGANDTGKALA